MARYVSIPDHRGVPRVMTEPDALVYVAVRDHLTDTDDTVIHDLEFLTVTFGSRSIGNRVKALRRLANKGILEQLSEHYFSLPSGDLDGGQ